MMIETTGVLDPNKAELKPLLGEERTYTIKTVDTTDMKVVHTT